MINHPTPGSAAEMRKQKQQRLYENMSNMQIKIDEKFQSPARSKKRAEKAMYRNIRKQMRPIRKLIEKSMSA